LHIFGVSNAVDDDSIVTDGSVVDAASLASSPFVTISSSVFCSTAMIVSCESSLLTSSFDIDSVTWSTALPRSTPAEAFASTPFLVRFSSSPLIV
jgi:hypothetical protein